MISNRFKGKTRSLAGNQADSGSAGRPHRVPWLRQVWDRDTCRFPTVPQSSLSFSRSKNKSVCLPRNCKEVRSVVCQRHAPQPEQRWWRTHPSHRHNQHNRPGPTVITYDITGWIGLAWKSMLHAIAKILTRQI